MPTWIVPSIEGGAAVIQAITAIVIVLLTVRLARIAKGALEESARQAKASEKALEAAAAQVEASGHAILETRKQRLVGSVPILDLSVDFAVVTDRETTGVFTVRNPGPSPAIEVRLLLYGITSDGKSEEQPRHRSKAIALLAAGESQTVTVPMPEFRNIPNPSVRDPRYARFSNDWIRVVVYCQGLQGARTSLRCDWLANPPDYDPRPDRLGQVKRIDEQLYLREVKILPDPQRREWEIVLETER